MLRLPCLIVGLFGHCLVPSAAQADPPIRLLSPIAGDRLTAGERARIEWSAEPGSLAPPTTEWEAFLSIDGGRTYPIRLTPHLDVALRGFSFEVPNVPSRDARLLLRFGDERTERIFETPARFEIGTAAAGRWAIEQIEESLARTLEPGEPARQGDDGVVLWMEGDREGRGLHPRIRIPRHAALTGIQPGPKPFLLALGPESGRLRIAPPTFTATDRPLHLGTIPPVEDLRAPLPLRLRIHRFNE